MAARLAPHPPCTGRVAGLDVAMPLVVVMVKSTSLAPAGTAVGIGSVLVVSSASLNGMDPSFVPSAVTLTVPTQPPRAGAAAQLHAGLPLGVGVDAGAEDADHRGEPVPGGAVVPLRVEAAVELEQRVGRPPCRPCR